MPARQESLSEGDATVHDLIETVEIDRFVAIVARSLLALQTVVGNIEYSLCAILQSAATARSLQAKAPGEGVDSLQVLCLQGFSCFLPGDVIVE